MTDQRYAVIGGGILGTAVAHRLLQHDPSATVNVWEKEADLAAHQTGRNSGVVHAGLYYEPGSLKAKLCRQGVGMLKEFCQQHEIAYDECGKVLVALDDSEASRLAEIERRATANGVPGIRRLNSEQIRDIEPHVRGVAGLHSPSTAIVDYSSVTRKLGDIITESGGSVRTSVEVIGLHEASGSVVLRGRHADGSLEEVQYDIVIVCAGLQSDRVATLAGDEPDPRIVPFRGEYYLLKPERKSLVNGLIYPVPDPRYPFLGVHMTPRVDGEVMVGPNAVLALAREGYNWTTASARDLFETFTFPGFTRFARRHWRTGLHEMIGSLSKTKFVEAARRYVPELTTNDVIAGPRGNRAQALDRDGGLVDDFRISRRGRVVALRNAPSPAATSSLAIAQHLVDTVLQEAMERP